MSMSRIVNSCFEVVPFASVPLAFLTHFRRNARAVSQFSTPREPDGRDFSNQDRLFEDPSSLNLHICGEAEGPVPRKNRLIAKQCQISAGTVS